MQGEADTGLGQRHAAHIVSRQCRALEEAARILCEKNQKLGDGLKMLVSYFEVMSRCQEELPGGRYQEVSTKD